MRQLLVCVPDRDAGDVNLLLLWQPLSANRDYATQALDAVMDVDNPFFALQHFIGKVTYVDSGEFDRFFSDPDY